MSNDCISIIVPVYNVEKYLKACLESLLGQSYHNIEVILVDDGSRDNSPIICDYYAAIDQRVKVIHKENGGASAARNTGIKAAKGKYIMFVDSDDYVDEDFVKSMIECMLEKFVDMVVCGYERVILNKNKVLCRKSITYGLAEYKNKDELYKDFYPFFDNKGFNTLWNKIYHANIIKDNNIRFIENINMAEDFLFNLKYIQYVTSCAFIDKPLYKYVISENYLSNRYEPNTFQNRIFVLNNIEGFLENNGLSKEAIAFLYIKAAYAHFMMLYHKDCSLTYEEKLQVVSQIINNTQFNDSIEKFRPKGIYEKVLFYVIKSRNEKFIYRFAGIVRRVYIKIKGDVCFKWYLKIMC
ncbi:glycosyltransferase [Haloimpatiens lingqiaonensis]|uniref:glycosyltransferase n=1 Tax=Haloimpatiens lingqiaonensis TaxID=1380675 RepID=UPI0010FDB170|nr:glycosyltransferase [Haloimpatiens lingqiaonensis]